MAKGLRCYNAREFFEAHEHWEGVWLGCAEPEKTFLQALIQIAAALHHLQRENRTGTASLLRRSLRKLEPYPAEFGGIDVDGLRRTTQAWLEALEGEDLPVELAIPRIR